jgi:hypothetical protein
MKFISFRRIPGCASGWRLGLGRKSRRGWNSKDYTGWWTKPATGNDADQRFGQGWKTAIGYMQSKDADGPLIEYPSFFFVKAAHTAPLRPPESAGFQAGQYSRRASVFIDMWRALSSLFITFCVPSVRGNSAMSST